MSLPDDTYSHYGFNFSTLLCDSLNLDLIKGVFGLEDETIITNVKPGKKEITWLAEQSDTPRAEVSQPLTEHEFRDSIQWQSSFRETDTIRTEVPQPVKGHEFRDTIQWRSSYRETDTESETTASEEYATRSVGVCVDCSCCMRFCDCNKASEIRAPVPTLCNPEICKHVVCSDCTFCTDHCTCRCEV